MITIKQIAEEAGVSKSTVSRYLNNGYVSEGTAKKIKKVIDKHNFTPNEFARSLKSEKSNFIGVIIPRIDSPSMMSMMDGIDRITQEHGYQMLISNTNLDVKREIESIQSLVQSKVAGIILFATVITEEHLMFQKSVNIPIMFVGQTHADVYSVNHDNYQAGKLLASKLVKFGHERVTYIGVPEQDISVGIERKKGVKDTFANNGVVIGEVESSFRTMDNYYLALDLLQSPQSSLYVTATDNMAMGFYRAAHDLDLTIGEDISVAGFGGYSFSEFLSPPLTTIDFHHELVGEMAAHNLLKRIADQPLNQNTKIDVSYLERQSVKKFI